ncbi:uroporphyrinogen-III C-methyltransferase [Vibrio hannami]|uniref:uroporphyrinogen-III C-methyltransferase n=1 Tax=Vibrio hannami TaxID=2717094 RepID=UPI003BB0CF45
MERSEMKSTRIQDKSYSIHGQCYREYTPAKSKPSVNHKGKVSLVGAGPGDPELLTIKALRTIEAAEVLVYDRLVSKEILQLANPDAEFIYVGKRCGQPSLSQENINQILVDNALHGKNTVRLKGGDPFIFGRGGEEAMKLVHEQIPYEVIPGITAAIGCASSSLIPLTHRKVSRSVTFITGHVVSGALPAWAGLVEAGQTLVFYMGLEKSQEIQTGLLSAGLSGDTPLAVIGKGCSPEQEVYTSQLSELTKLAESLKGLSPALLILGEVVNLRKELLATAHEQYVQHIEG